MTTMAHEDLKRVLELHRKWYYGEEGGVRANLDGANLGRANLDGANLVGANLVGANLVGANLGRANLVRANLDGANLGRANLDGANLGGANLDGANLVRANLDGANLGGANLVGANLVGANLVRANLGDSTTLSDGVTWKQYLAELVPALLVAGGRALVDVANPAVWNCHTWSNCPMHAAFGADNLDGVPVLHRWQAGRFIQLFDAKLIPLEAIPGASLEGAAACEVPA